MPRQDPGEPYFRVDSNEARSILDADPDGTVVIDVRREIYDQRTDVGIGTEYALFPSFALRAGYASQFSGTSGGGGALSSLGGLGAGFGIRMKTYRADYTFTPFGDLGNVQRISLGARF